MARAGAEQRECGAKSHSSLITNPATCNRFTHTTQAATEGLLKSAVTCGALSLAGDLLAQGLGHKLQVRCWRG
jgi:hypothetical protein